MTTKMNGITMGTRHQQRYSEGGGNEYLFINGISDGEAYCKIKDLFALFGIASVFS